MDKFKNNKPSHRVAAVWAAWLAFSLAGLAFSGLLYLPYVIVSGIALVPLCQHDGKTIAYGLACCWPAIVPTLFVGTIFQAFICFVLTSASGFLAREVQE